MNNHLLQNTEEEPIRARFERSLTRRTHEVPFIAGRSHFTRKNTRFLAPAFSQNETHATSMQPLQCVLQHQVANTHLSTHMATQNDNNHAAIYTAICNQRFKKRIESRTHEQPLFAEHRGGTDSRGTFHRRPGPLYTEGRKVSCPGFLPKRSPCNIHAAITMRFATSGCKPAPLDAHGNTKRQQSCSHYTAICNQKFKKRKESHTHEQPCCRTQRRNRFAPGSSTAAPVAQTRYLSSPAGATLHGKTQGFLPRLSPKTKPMQHPCSQYNTFSKQRFQNTM